MKMSPEVRSSFLDAKAVFVATSDKTGEIHLAVTQEMKIPDDQHVIFDEWFCRRTLENLQVNPQIAIGVLDPVAGKGYQLIGEVEDVASGAMMDGFGGKEEEKWSGLPQAKHRLRVRVDSVLELNTGPHSDTEIE